MMHTYIDKPRTPNITSRASYREACRISLALISHKTERRQQDDHYESLLFTVYRRGYIYAAYRGREGGILEA